MSPVVFRLAFLAGLLGLAVPLCGQVLQFDFAPEGSAPRPGVVQITPNSHYAPGASYGLLSDSLTPVERPDLKKNLGAAASDGLSKAGPIEFRVDLPKGRYVIEVGMDGGTLETWQGEISVNGTVLVRELESFGYSAESHYAPPYWGCLREFQTDSNRVIVRVRAEGQRTALNTLAIYPYRTGPVRFTGGAFQRTPAAVAPNFDLALKLVNAGKVVEATRVIDAIPGEFSVDRAYLLMALASRPEAQTPRALIESAYALLSAEYARAQSPAFTLDLRLVELYLTGDQHFKQAGWQWARDLNGLGIFGNCEISGVSASEVASIPAHPLWPASTWLLAKTCYWLYIEQHVPRMIVRADSLFRLLRNVFPDHPLIGTYLADSQEHFPDIPRSSEVPRWAELQYVLANRLKDIIHYWCESRQGSGGEFGGKYDDDVEMLRWWPFARVGIDDSLTLQGMRRLVNGIWESNWISNGWCRVVRDVEHSSEPVADTQPMMIAFEYGNPVFVERCMQSVRLALNLWTKKNGHGHRHFRSSWYSSTEVDTSTPKDCDVPYNTRTVKAIRWFAWYTHHPEALRFLREWADAWLEDCLRTEKGKPAGIVPAAIRFSDDAIGGHANNWHHPGLYWRYYDYDGGSDILMEFLSCYRLSGDRKYLKPMELSLELVGRHAADPPGAPEGSESWAASVLRRSEDFWQAVEVWRLITGEKRFDALLSRNSSPFLRYRLASAKGPLEAALEETLKDIGRNYPLLTTEAYFTDRVDVRDLRGPDNNNVSILESMYLGTPLGKLFYPYNPVFWKKTDSSFSALVEEFSSTLVRARVFNHATSSSRGEATFLHLEPGEYEVLQGSDPDGDGTIDRVREKGEFLLTQRNTSYSFSFPARTEEVIIVRQRRPGRAPVEALCDLALSADELRITPQSGGVVEVSLPVHNIGTADAADISVMLVRLPENLAVTGEVGISRIAAPLDLLPKSQRVSFTIPQRAGRYAIRVSSRGSLGEITRDNNVIEFTL